jgi:Ca-activated chloride channel family protein
VYSNLQQQIGYQIVKGDASEPWIMLGVAVLIASLLAGVLINRWLPQ